MIQDHKDLSDHKVHKVLQVHKEVQDHKVHKEIKVLQEVQDLRDLKELLEIKEELVLQDLKEAQELTVIKVLQELLDLLGEDSLDDEMSHLRKNIGADRGHERALGHDIKDDEAELRRARRLKGRRG